MQTLPQSRFISPFELPVSSESQGETGQPGTLLLEVATEELQKVPVEGPGIALREKSPLTISCPKLPALCGHPSTALLPLMRTRLGSGYDRCCCGLWSLLSP